jgi:hypothetical protein
MPLPRSTVLPVAYVVLRILIVLNWLYGAAILGLVIFANTNRAWFMKAIDVPQGLDPNPIMMGLTAIATLGLLAVPLNHLILTRLLRMVETVSRGDPFVAATPIGSMPLPGHCWAFSCSAWSSAESARRLPARTFRSTWTQASRSTAGWP